MPDPVVHFEIISTEAPNLHRFYGSVFGWKIAVDNPFGYGMIDTRTPGRGISGGIGAPLPGGRGHFTIYVQVPNIDAALSRVITEGGRIAMAKTTVPNGPTLAQFFDPAGHLMGLVEGSNQAETGAGSRVATPSARPTATSQASARGLLRPRPKPAVAAKPKPKAKTKPKVKPKIKAKPKAKAKKSAAKKRKGKSRR